MWRSESAGPPFGETNPPRRDVGGTRISKTGAGTAGWQKHPIVQLTAREDLLEFVSSEESRLLEGGENARCKAAGAEELQRFRFLTFSMTRFSKQWHLQSRVMKKHRRSPEKQSRSVHLTVGSGIWGSICEIPCVHSR